MCPCTALLNLHNARVHTGFPRQNYPNGSGICFLANSKQGAGIAQLVEHPTAKPGAILTQVRVPGTARDFSVSHLPVANSKHWFTTSFPSTTAIFSYAIGSRKLSDKRAFFVVVGAQNSSKGSLQTTQIISDVCFITDHVAYASSNKTKIV